MEQFDALVWAFEHFYFLDRSNAAIHCAKTKFSPITFKLAHAIGRGKLIDVDIVLNQAGQYELDGGR